MLPGRQLRGPPLSFLRPQLQPKSTFPFTINGNVDLGGHGATVPRQTLRIYTRV